MFCASLVNGLNKDLREILIGQDDLLKTPFKTAIKRIATLEEESGGILQVASVRESSQGDNLAEDPDTSLEH